MPTVHVAIFLTLYLFALSFVNFAWLICFHRLCEICHNVRLTLKNKISHKLQLHLFKEHLKVTLHQKGDNVKSV